MKAMRDFTSEYVSDAVLKEYKEQWYEFVQGPSDIMLYEEVVGFFTTLNHEERGE